MSRIFTAQKVMPARILIFGFWPLVFVGDKLLPCPVTRPEEATSTTFGNRGKAKKSLPNMSLRVEQGLFYSGISFYSIGFSQSYQGQQMMQLSCSNIQNCGQKLYWVQQDGNNIATR